MSSRVYISTLGCDKNLVDSEALLGRFAARGVEMSVTPEDADIWVLNTCGFIDAARRDSLDSIAAMSAAKGGRKLVVTGCLTQEMGESIAAEFPGIDVIGGVGNFEKLIDALEMGRDRVPIGRPEDASYAGLADRPLLTPPHVAFVKIAEGCNFKCSFCRIPIIRGKQISRPVAEVAAEVRGLVERGVREVQLVAQNLSDYGRGRGEDLLDLCTELDAVADLRRIRLLYLYPGLISPERFRRILDLDRVAPYVDMPVQHASARMLKRMSRPADIAALRRFLLDLRAERPELVLRTTVLLGFPGEEEDDVEELADFLAEVRFDHLGTYRYSPEEGTAGAGMTDRPDPEEVADREARILDIQAECARERQSTRLGEEFDLVVDRVGPASEWIELIDDLGSDEAEQMPGFDAGAALDELRRGTVAVARSWHFGYDLDGVVLLRGDDLRPGRWLRGRFAAATPYDVLAVATD